MKSGQKMRHTLYICNAQFIFEVWDFLSLVGYKNENFEYRLPQAVELKL